LEPAQLQERPDEAHHREVGQLLARAKTGDRRSLDAIVGRFMPLVWNIARAEGLDTEAASDVVQAAWVALLERLHDIHSPQALVSRLITVTCGEARRQRGDRRAVPAGPPDPVADLSADLADRERFRCLWRNFIRLSPRCQELLRIVAFVDPPDSQMVAERFGSSTGPNRGQCLAQLKALLAADPSWSMR